MKKELQEQLYKKYPKIFRQKDLPMTQTCMCWGIDTGDGWYSILDTLCNCIQGHVDNKVKTLEAQRRNLTLWTCIKEFFLIRLGCWWDMKRVFAMFSDWAQSRWPVNPDDYQVEAAQVKEKFGTLRFYTDQGDDIINSYVTMAEALTAITCEECGRPGKANQRGWIKVLCDKCRVDREKGRKGKWTKQPPKR